MKKFKIFVVCSSLIFLNCTIGMIGLKWHKDSMNKIRENLLFIHNAPLSDILTSPQEAVDKCETTEIVFNHSISSNIDILDPIIVIDRSDSIRSNFEIYHFMVDKDLRMKININSYCYKHGMGFSKFAMVPLIFLLDSKNNLLSFEKISMSFISPPLIPWYIACVFETTLNESGTYYLIIASENRFAGKEVGSMKKTIIWSSTYGHDYSNFELPIIATPTGKYNLKISIK